MNPLAKAIAILIISGISGLALVMLFPRPTAPNVLSTYNAYTQPPPWVIMEGPIGSYVLNESGGEIELVNSEFEEES